MNENEIRNYLKEETSQIPVPESLSPDSIEDRLAPITPIRRTPFLRRHMVAAAVLFLVLIGTVLTSKNLPFNRDTTKDSESIADNKTTQPDQISYQDAYESIHTYQKNTSQTNLDRYTGPMGGGGLSPTKDKLYEEDVEAESSTGNSDNAKNYTTTDTQVDGIMEGDTVKTDGSYLYSRHDTSTGCQITIHSVNGEKVKKVSDITIETNQIHDMYLEKGRLIIVSSPWDTEVEYSYDGGYPIDSSTQLTRIDIYDVSDPSSPKKIKTQTQSGNYSTSRIAGNYLYTFSEYSVNQEIDKDKPETYIPKINGTVIPEDRVRCIDREAHKTYVVMTSLAVDGSKDYTDSITTLGGADVFYVSDQYIYGTDSQNNTTKITKYQYKEGKFTYHAKCQVRGTIVNSYYLHEQNGNLCFVYHKTTITGRETNGLCILDKNLKRLGEITNLGNDETIYASYFIGNMAYFVTYRETDPVFAVDISKPASPVLKSELKLPGFSDYLHSFGDNQLIGLGLDEDKYEQCAKISVFSIDKKKKITESTKKKLPAYLDTLASYDRHSVLIDEERQLVGFPATDDEEERYDYLLFSYNRETGRFKQMLKQKDISVSTRGIRIGDYFYVVDGETGITCYAFPTCGTPGTLEEPLSFTSN